MTRTRNTQRGLAIVEAALVFPLVILLFLAVGELGRGIFQFNTLHKAVRDGAREAAELADVGLNNLATLTAADAQRVRNLVACGSPTCAGDARLLPGFQPGQVTVTPAGADILVTATYTFQPVFAAGIPTFGYGDGSNIVVGPTLRASASMRALQ